MRCLRNGEYWFKARAGGLLLCEGAFILRIEPREIHARLQLPSLADIGKAACLAVCLAVGDSASPLGAINIYHNIDSRLLTSRSSHDIAQDGIFETPNGGPRVPRCVAQRCFAAEEPAEPMACPD